MLWFITDVMLYNMCHLMLRYITCVMLCYVIQHVSCYKYKTGLIC